jgi:hypothetical protein
MRYLVFGFCVFATACAGTSPTAPTSSLSSSAATSSLSPIGGAVVTQAQHGSELPFKGNLQATEVVAGAVHHLVGTGNGTHLGRFTYAADITVDEQTGEGVGTVIWTAANGDQIFAATQGEIVLFDFPTLTLRETQVITGGTGRFSGASGTIIVDRSLDLLTGNTAGSYSGGISLGD